MIITAIIVTGAIALASITVYASMSYADHQGYLRGLDDAEKIYEEVKNEKIRGVADR